jgi:hypothetical protein
VRTLAHTAALATALLVANAGCKRGNVAPMRPTPPPTATTDPTFVIDPALENSPVATPDALDDEIRRRGAITFRSWNGKWIGTDCDTDLTFLPGAVVHLFEYADMVLEYNGTFTITDRGEVTVRCPKLSQPWPVLTLRRDDQSLILLPRQSVQSIDLANPVGGTTTAGRGSYWPLRPITGKDARVVRERINHSASNIDRQ